MNIFCSRNIISLLFGFFILGLSAQTQKDSLENKIRKELQIVKALREKDSIKMDLLTQELKKLMFVTESSNVSSTQVDSILIKQKAEIDKLRQKIDGVPVVFFSDTLFSVYASIGPYGADIRANNITEKLNLLYKKPFFFTDSLRVKHANGFYNIIYQNEVITGITTTDALWANTIPEELAENQAKIIRETIVKHRQQNSLKNNLLRVIELLTIIAIAMLIIWIINRFFRMFESIFISPNNRFLNGIKIKNYELLKKEHLLTLVSKVVSFIKILLFIILFITVLPLAFSVFPSTQNWSEVMREWISDPIKSIWYSVLDYLPKLIRIIIVLIIVRYVLRFLRFLSLEIERGALTIKGFYPEWSRTTYALTRFLLLMLTLVIIFPLLPGSDSTAFKGISVFLGILISIGSSSAVANAVAGLVITYMRPFKSGDWIKTGNITGIVIEKNALVTRLKTINNEDVSVPNSAVLSGATINYSSIGRTDGLVITAVVKVRYDYPQNVIEELLLDAALKTNHIAKEPYPYVFQLALGEINAAYELNAFTFAPENMYFIKSDLIKNIQNVFKQANIEIQSTQYVEIKKSDLG